MFKQAYFSPLASEGYYCDDHSPLVGVLLKYLLLGSMTEPKPKALQLTPSLWYHPELALLSQLTDDF